MKITIKTLQQKQFQLDVDPEDKVLAVKQKIEQSHEHAVSRQKLIFEGKILADDKSLSEYEISEKGFLVLMVSNSKPPAKPANTPQLSGSNPSPSTTAPLPNSQRTPTITAQQPAVIQAPVAPLTSSTPQNPPPPTQTSTNTATTTTPSIPDLFGNASALVTGADYENVIQSIMELGYDRDQVVKAMRASFNNPDRAVEYLMTEIPPETDQSTSISEPVVNQPQTVSPTAPSTGSSTHTAIPQNLFQVAQQQQQQGGTDELSVLRSHPQFQQLRRLVQENPALLQPLLQQIGQSNPQLLQLINANPAMFLRLLQENGEETGEVNLPPPQYVSVTQEEKEAIDRLVDLGFDRALAIEAFLACDRNEELAANYLFEHMNEEEN
ncbi:11512_t:CDS:2 [Acaulospora morrowiae]|uniref:UV excision repair protein RAD23 n=1 Tax=Acaulospora morrowiae TaxID=94023 RepID=A0A9N9A9M4_9GLOM|nr:11512_t:CDS:2 [Acaulospora morrowiae]